MYGRFLAGGGGNNGAGGSGCLDDVPASDARGGGGGAGSGGRIGAALALDTATVSDEALMRRNLHFKVRSMELSLS